MLRYLKIILKCIFLYLALIIQPGFSPTQLPGNIKFLLIFYLNAFLERSCAEVLDKTHTILYGYIYIFRIMSIIELFPHSLCSLTAWIHPVTLSCNKVLPCKLLHYLIVDISRISMMSNIAL